MSIQSPPEGVQTINAEGADLAAALSFAASELGVPQNGVQWTLDRSWFRDPNGRTIARDTVRILAWPRNMEELEAANDAQSWVQGLLERMDFESSEVRGDVASDNTVILKITVDKPSRLVGRRGKTLNAIRHLLMQSVGADYPDHTFRLEVPDSRSRDERDDRGRDRDRDRGRGRGRDRDRGERRKTSARDAKRLERMAEKIAARVRKTGEPELIRKELNAFDRRIVHVAVSELDGVGTRSIGEGSFKQIEIYPEAGETGEE